MITVLKPHEFLALKFASKIFHAVGSYRPEGIMFQILLFHQQREALAAQLDPIPFSSCLCLVLGCCACFLHQGVLVEIHMLPVARLQVHCMQ